MESNVILKTTTSRMMTQIDKLPLKIDEYYFTPEHLWVGFCGAIAHIGLTQKFIEEKGKIKSIDFDTEIDIVKKYEIFALIDTERRAERIAMPVDGKIFEINPDLAQDIKNMNRQKQGIWLMKIAPLLPPDLFELMSETDYNIEFQ